MTKHRRCRVLADPRLQGILCYRLALYWVCCLLSVGLILGWGEAFEGGHNSSQQWLAQFWQHHGATIILPLLALPFAMLDLLIQSNKFAGPLLRLRRSMQALANGEPGEPLRLRRGDYFIDLAEDFNQIVDRMQELDAKEGASAVAASQDSANV